MTAGERIALIALGSNMGDRLAELQAGLDALQACDAVVVLDVSSVWESAYVGPGDQDDYLNACCRLSTALAPADLLHLLQSIERARGRRPDGHMKPRPLDLDILLLGDLVVTTTDLVIPHPRLRERAFVLEPLAELDADRILPDSRETVGGLCEKIRGAEGQDVRRRIDAVVRVPDRQ